VPALLVLDARLRLLGPSGSRDVKLVDVLRFDGMRPMDIQPGELLTHVLVPKPAPGSLAASDKLAMRDSIDFPMLNVAVTARFDADLLADLRIAIGAISPKPRLLPGLDAYRGQRLDAARIDSIAQGAWRRSRPQAATAGDTGWRRDMVRVMVRRLLTQVSPAS